MMAFGGVEIGGVVGTFLQVERLIDDDGEGHAGVGDAAARIVDVRHKGGAQHSHTADEMAAVVGRIMDGEGTPAQVGALLAEMRNYAPDVVAAAGEAVAKATRDLDFTRLDAQSFAKAPSISIDYAIMEKTANAAVVPSPFKWSDLGSWDSVWKTGTRDPNGNVATANTTLVNSRNSLVMSHGVHLAVQGMEDVAVIASEDAVYVGKLQDSQSVGDLVKTLEYGAVPVPVQVGQQPRPNGRPDGATAQPMEK